MRLLMPRVPRDIPPSLITRMLRMLDGTIWGLLIQLLRRSSAVHPNSICQRIAAHLRLVKFCTAKYQLAKTLFFDGFWSFASTGSMLACQI